MFIHSTSVTRSQSQQQTALLRKIVEGIHDSLDLRIVLQTTVDDLTEFLHLDYGAFFWFFEETQQIRVISERIQTTKISSQQGDHALGKMGILAGAIATHQVLVNGKQWQDKRGLRQRLFGRLNPVSFPKIWNCSAHFLIPISTAPNLAGFFLGLSQSPRSWKPSEIAFLQSLVQPLEVAVAFGTSHKVLAQSKFNEEIQQIAKREQLINQITSQTRSSLDIETILTEAIAQLRIALNADRCLVHLVEDSQNHSTLDLAQETLTQAAFRRKHLYEVYNPNFSSSINSFDTHGPITEWVIQHRQSVMIADVTQDPRIGTNNLEYQQAQIRSSLVVPVQTKDKLYGIIYLNQCSHPRHWLDNDQQLAQAVADQLAISIQQAHLFAQTRQQASQSAAQAQQLAETLQQLKLAQTQLIQTEKMSSLGQMVAGVAHEINNPVSFIHGNIPYLENYLRDVLRLLQAYQAHYPQPNPRLQSMAEEIELDFLRQDLPEILNSMKAGTERIREVIQLLQNFSRLNQSPLKSVDINATLETTLLMLHHRLQRCVQIKRQYGKLPLVECYPKSINQVFLSIITNAIESLERSEKDEKVISLHTEEILNEWQQVTGVRIAIADNGVGIPLEVQPRIFDPFFTTKDVGKGRGLGLAESYQTVVEQHNGHLKVASRVGEGTKLIIEIPLQPISVSPLPSSIPKATAISG